MIFEIRTQVEALTYIGTKFRDMLYLSKHRSDLECGEEVMKRYILVNCEDPREKWYVLIHLLRKLYALAGDEIQNESTDSMDTQEVRKIVLKC